MSSKHGSGARDSVQPRHRSRTRTRMVKNHKKYFSWVIIEPDRKYAPVTRLVGVEVGGSNVAPEWFRWTLFRWAEADETYQISKYIQCVSSMKAVMHPFSVRALSNFNIIPQGPSTFSHEFGVLFWVSVESVSGECLLRRAFLAPVERVKNTSALFLSIFTVSFEHC